MSDPEKVDPSELPTPRISGSFSLYRTIAFDVAASLRGHRAEIAGRRTVFTTALLVDVDAKIAEAEGLAATFGTWPTCPPDMVDRTSLIQRILDLRAQVRSYLDGER